MDNTQGSAVTPAVSGQADATASTESASVEQTTQEPAETSEKMQNTQAGEGDQQEAANESKESKATPTIPYDRFKEVNDELKAAKEKALLFDRLQQDPDLAAAYFRNTQSPVKQDPVLQQADQTLREMGYLPASEVKRIIDERITKERVLGELRSKFETLAAKYDGKDGAPKFEPTEVAEYMEKYGVMDPEIAYEVMHKDGLADLRAKQKKTSVYTEKPGQPQQTSGTDMNAALEEAKNSGNWGKYLLGKVGSPFRQQ